MQQHRAYRYRLVPTTEQEAGLYRFAGVRRWLWKWAVQRKQQHDQQHQAGLSCTAVCTELPAFKATPPTAWLNELESHLLQQAVRDLDQAFSAFFARQAR